MRKIVIAVITLFILSMVSCEKPAESIVQSSNKEFKVEKLFTVDSITVYRFTDQGYHYFTKNETSQQVSCGKNCTREEVIPNL
jgi:hypothetical protein